MEYPQLAYNSKGQIQVKSWGPGGPPYISDSFDWSKVPPTELEKLLAQEFPQHSFFKRNTALTQAQRKSRKNRKPTKKVRRNRRANSRRN